MTPSSEHTHDPAQAGELDPRSFDARAADWDTPDRVARAKVASAAIRGAVTFPHGARAIDIGAGTGLLGLSLLDLLGELVLADTSDGMLDQARRKIHDAGYDNVQAIHLDLIADPSPDSAPFDVVMSQLLLHHVEDTSAALSAMHRLLVPGGQLVVMDLDTEDGSFHGSVGTSVHHLGFDRDALATTARSVGFADVQVGDGGDIGDAEQGEELYPMFLLTARRA
jgi:ubiquinone/menaquinone biosynthesis C-methylase UbiE